jgi:hypothetical protein
MGRKKGETRKQQLVRECSEIVTDIRYYSQYPYATWLGKLISKLILRNLKSRLNRKEEELTKILRKGVMKSSTINKKREEKND